MTNYDSHLEDEQRAEPTSAQAAPDGAEQGANGGRPGADQPGADQSGAGDQGAQRNEAAHENGGADTEAEILRGELKRLRERSDALAADLKEANDRVLRARAEMETMRRRLLAEVDGARDAGRDEATMPVLAVYDDLERALAVAAESDDPASIVTGVQLVKENLERQLASLGIRRVGNVGEHFDPHYHEALTTIPAAPGLEPGTIAQVFEPGFVQGDRLVRVARVVVVADHGAAN